MNLGQMNRLVYYPTDRRLALAEFRQAVPTDTAPALSGMLRVQIEALRAAPLIRNPHPRRGFINRRCERFHSIRSTLRDIGCAGFRGSPITTGSQTKYQVALDTLNPPSILIDLNTGPSTRAGSRRIHLFVKN
jgi:hypothetical protein